MSDTTTPQPLRFVPNRRDLDTEGFFAAALENRLVVRACRACGKVLHLPRSYCKGCGSWDVEWRDVAGTATVYSWTVVTHQVHPAYPTPYTVVLVELDDAPAARLVGYLPGTPALRPGQPMKVEFETLHDGSVIPQWVPTGTD